MLQTFQPSASYIIVTVTVCEFKVRAPFLILWTPGVLGKNPLLWHEVSMVTLVCIFRKNAVELELAKCKMDMMSLNSQLLDAIQQKLNLSQQLEAWQVREGKTRLQEESVNTGRVGFTGGPGAHG